MRDGDDAHLSFVRMRRCRSVALGLGVVLLLVMIVALLAASTGGGSDSDSPMAWQLVGNPFFGDESVTDLSTQEFTDFGFKVKMDKDANVVAIAKKAVDGSGGAVHVWSHIDPNTLKIYTNTWFLETVLKFPPFAGAGVHDEMAMDMSEDGRRIVFNTGNTLQVYFANTMDRQNNGWSPLGDMIVPSATHPSDARYASEIAMSGNGFYIAVLGYTETEPAFVDIFHYVSTRNEAGDFVDQWNLVNTIQLLSPGPASLAFDTFGKQLVIGEAGHDILGPKISVYFRQSDEDPSTWIKGADALNSDSRVSHTPTYRHIVSVSGDGTRIAHGTLDGNGNSFGVLEAQQGDQGVYWTGLGTTMKGASDHEKFGASVAISMDGNRVAVGAPGTPDLDIQGDTNLEQYLHGRIRLYEFEEIQREWKEVVAAKSSAEPGDGLGASVSISEFGHDVAVGAPYGRNMVGRTMGVAGVYHISS